MKRLIYVWAAGVWALSLSPAAWALGPVGQYSPILLENWVNSCSGFMSRVDYMIWPKHGVSFKRSDDKDNKITFLSGDYPGASTCTLDRELNSGNHCDNLPGLVSKRRATKAEALELFKKAVNYRYEQYLNHGYFDQAVADGPQFCNRNSLAKDKDQLDMADLEATIGQCKVAKSGYETELTKRVNEVKAARAKCVKTSGRSVQGPPETEHSSANRAN